MEVSERTRVDLPPSVPAAFEVFVNGVRQDRGVDYEVIGRSLVFPRPVAQEGRLGFWRWLSMWLGIAGSVSAARDASTSSSSPTADAASSPA